MNIARIGTLAIAGALLGAGIYAAGIRGLADARYFTARTILTETLQSKRRPDADRLGAAREALEVAHSLEPSNPLFVEQLARVHEMAALVLERVDPAAQAALRQSLAGFRKAALQRPGSPYVWAAIAGLKLRLDEMDFEFYGALQRAERFGQWEPAIQLALADVGLAGWRLLAQPGKALVQRAIERGLARQEKEIRALAQTHGTLALFCAEASALVKAGICVKV